MAIFRLLKSQKIRLKADEYSTAASYRADLYQEISGRVEYKLVLSVSLRLEQINRGPYWFTLDYDGKMFWIQNWTEAEWTRLLNGAFAAAAFWNNRIWLVPPNAFTDFDQPIATGMSWRPFIKCELAVDFFAFGFEPDAVIKIAKLDPDPVLNPAGGDFRSSSRLLVDTAIGTQAFTVPDAYGARTNYQQPTFVHEIGHNLGLHHVGVARGAPLCKTAVNLVNFPQDALPWEFQGGIGAPVCYGWGHLPDFSKNIEGYGSALSAENANPWIWAMMMMTPGPYGIWKAVLPSSDPGTRFVEGHNSSVEFSQAMGYDLTHSL